MAAFVLGEKPPLLKGEGPPKAVEGFMVNMNLRSPQPAPPNQDSSDRSAVISE